MRRLMLLVFVGLLSNYSIVLKANPVDMRTVCEVAVKFVNANTKVSMRGSEDLVLVTTYNIDRGDVAFHVFNTPNGFVIVAADDCATPILGYSDEGRLFDPDNVPIQLQGYLQGFVEQIQYGIENHIEDVTTARQWELVQATGKLNENRDGDVVVEPLINANWGQGCYYNAMCPEDENGQCGHVPTGCVATAMGMIMHYWGFPMHGNGSHTYTPYGYPAQTADFGETTYDWGNMPDQLTETSSQTEIDAVSTLLWHCGVSMDMNYAVGGSGAFVQDMRTALNNVFYYNCNQVEELGVNQYVTTNQWFAKIKSNLDEGMPILYSGYTSDDLGHAWVCDGYDADSLLHFNWGWSGAGNGYFAIGASNVFNWEFNEAIQTIFDIHPQCDANSVIQVTAYVNDSLAGYVIGGGEYGCEQECTLTAVANEGYHFVKWIEFRDDIPSYYGGNYTVSINSNYTFCLTHDRWLTAVFAEDGEGCNLVFDIYDSGGDGLNGGGLEIYYGDGSWERLSFGSGSFASFTREFLNNSHVMIWWSLGNGWGEYSYIVRFENSAVIHHNLGITEYFTFNSYEFDLNCEDQFTPRTITAEVNPENSGIVTGGGVYHPGDTCTLSAIPNEGHAFAFWEENGEIISTDSTMAFIVGIIDRHFTAHYGPYHISLSSNLEEGGNVNGGGSFNLGDTCTIHAVPNEGYVFVYWIENGNVVSCSDEYSFVVMDDMDLVAVFATEDSVCNITLFFDGFNWKGHGMTVDYGNGITEIIAPEEWTLYPFYSRCVYDGNHITISWTNGGYTWGFSFDIRYGNGTMIYHGEWGDNSQYEFDVNCDWAYASYDITATANPTEGGVINGAGSFSWGKTCTLTATPNEGYDFLYWSENGMLVSRDSLCSFMVNNDRNLIAHFVSEDIELCNMVFELGTTDPYVITEYWIPGNLLIVDYGDGVCESLTTEEDENYQTTGYAIHTRPVRNGNQITLGFVEGSYYEYANFILYYENGDTTYKITSLDNNFHCVFNANCEDAIIDETYSITVSANYGEGGMVEGGGQYSFGQICTLTATPGENYIFAYWAKDGILVSYSPTYSFNAVENANYEAVFIKGVLVGKNYTGMGAGLPSESIANYSFSKQIYTFDEISISGFIENIAFYSSETAGHPKTRNYEVYLVHTDIDSFDSGDVLFSEEDRVFSGEVTMGVDRWSVIELSAPFYYNGIDNLALLVIDNTNIQDGGVICRVFDTEECQAKCGWSDETPFSISNIDGGQGLVYKNQVYFGGEFTAIPPRTITITANPEAGGTVNGAGIYDSGTIITVTATPNEGYFFKCWTEEGNYVSYDAAYSFVVKNNRNLTADFGEDGIIDFVDENVKNICVERWDTNNDGELSYGEAAAVTSLDNAFSWNSEITSFDELQYFVHLSAINGNEFNCCNNLTSIVIPDAVASIGNIAFEGCYSLASIEIPSSVASFGFCPFRYCPNLMEIVVDICNPVYDSRDNCNAIIETATNTMIIGCVGSVIHNTVTAIGESAFNGCYQLSSIGFPNSVEYIGVYSFVYCPNIASIIVQRETPPVLGWGAFEGVDHGIPVYVPCGSLSAYQNADGWNEFTYFVEICGVTQSLTFTPGWNWFSSFIEYDESALSNLQGQLDASGVTALIKSQNAFVSNESGSWAGSLDSLDNTQTYMIRVDNGITVTLSGMALEPSEHPITIRPGWNWVGYYFGETMSLEEFFSGITLMDGDIIKSQSTFCSYSTTSGWSGNLTTLEPGKGYLFMSNGNTDRVLSFPTKQ